MNPEGRIFLVDGAVRRRAETVHRLAADGIHVEPHEDVNELLAHWPYSGIILAHDCEDVIARLVEHMHAAGAWLPVIGFAESPEPRRVVNAIQAGAVDYLAWPAQPAELTAALARAADATARQGPERRRESRARNRVDTLSPRERQVLACVAEGMSNRAIGVRLTISPRTVEIHRSNMMSKLGANHVSEAIRAAFDAALV